MLQQTDTVFQGNIDMKGRVRDQAMRIEPRVAKMSVGSETANVIPVTVQLQAPDAAPINHKAYVQAYLSSDAAGDVLEATGPDAIAIGTNGTLFKSGGDSVVQFGLKAEVTGAIDINVTKSGEDTFYLNVILPNGVVNTSTAITFDATT